MPRKRKRPPGLWVRDGVYWARFTARGRLIRERLSTDFDTAYELLNELRCRADRGVFDLIDNDYAWENLKDEFLKWARQSTRCAEDYATDLAWFEKYSRVNNVSQISEEWVIGFRNWRLDHTTARKVVQSGKPVTGQPIAPRTINKHVATLNNMLNRGVAWRRIGSNPIDGLKPLHHDEKRKERRSLTLGEVESLFEESPPYLRPVWRMFMVTGIRKGELRNMLFNDVDYERKTVTVRAGTAKNHKAREIPLDDETLEMLRAMQQDAMQRQPIDGWNDKLTAQQRASFSRDHVFVTNANTPWRNNLLTRFYACCKRAGIEGAEARGTVDIHALRVSFATLTLENGASPKAVQAILGHSTLALTMGVYARATDRAKRDAVGALPFASMSAPEGVIPMQKAHALRTVRKSSTQPQSETRLA
ncbi:MAG: site-specific integrase [Planctomycetes bacterium]|nr:site-specific integrase [Planctomycetota bacterium]